MMLEGCGGDQGIRHADPGFTTDPTGPLGDGAVDWKLTKGLQQGDNEIRGRRTGEELRPGDHRIVQPMSSWFDPRRSPKVIDEHVGIDEDVSHDPTHPDPVPTCP